MVELRSKIKQFNRVIRLLLIAQKRTYFIKQNERIKRNSGVINYYGCIMNVLIDKYHILHSEIEVNVSKIPIEKLQATDLWNELSYFKTENNYEEINQRY